jgi:hypothetical protein
VTHGLRPFWRYFGAKWRIAPRNPKPRHRTIIEPFAGAAGYSLRYPDHDVILVEKYHVIAEIWRWLIAAQPDEVRAIPCVDAVADLPSWIPDGARWLVGMCFGAGDTRPRERTSPMVARDGGWPVLQRRAAAQVSAIKHWRVIEGDYTAAPHSDATWFIDPPYFDAGARDRSEGGRGRVRYPFGADELDHEALALWCRGRRGQAIVCESLGATWLPFQSFVTTIGVGGAPSREAIWWQDTARSQTSFALESRP